MTYGGNLILSDPAGSQVDVVVSTSDDARPEDRYVRFGGRGYGAS